MLQPVSSKPFTTSILPSIRLYCCHFDHEICVLPWLGFPLQLYCVFEAVAGGVHAASIAGAGKRLQTVRATGGRLVHEAWQSELCRVGVSGGCTNGAAIGASPL